MSNLELYSGALGEFAFDVDDPTTTAIIDDMSAATWFLRLRGADDTFLEVQGTYVQPTVTVTIETAVSETITPGFYRWYLVADQPSVDEIVAGNGVLNVLAYPGSLMTEVS